MDLHYREYGNGEPLLVLHGLFGSADNWQTACQALAAYFHVFALDLRNHGQSPHSPEMDYPAMAADVTAFLDRQKFSSAHVLGHSLGGKVAMQLALSSPLRVRRAVIVDIAPRAYPRLHHDILEALLEIDPQTVRERKAADTVLAGRIPDLAVRQFLLKNLARQPDGSFRWKFNLPAIAAHFDQLQGALPARGSFTGPILFVRGQNSAYLREQDWREIRERFPQARLAVIPGAGHWVHAEAPALFVAVVSDFLKENAP